MSAEVGAVAEPAARMSEDVPPLMSCPLRAIDIVPDP